MIVGSGNVLTAKRVSEIDGQTRTLSDELTKVEQQIRKHMLAPFDLSKFLALPTGARDATGAEIVRTEAVLAAARKTTEIVSRPQLETIHAPVAPAGVAEKMATTFASLHEDAAHLLAEHLRHLGTEAETWIFQGTSHVHGDDCPFCGQLIAESHLVRAYGAYFSTAYRDHQRDVHQLLNEVDRLLGEEVSHRLEKAIAANVARIDKWADLIDLRFVQTPATDPRPILDRLRTLLRDALNSKLRTPSVSAAVGPDLAAARIDPSLRRKLQAEGIG